MSPLILHHYDASPYTQRVLKMLAIKRLGWQSVQTPMLPPKDDLVVLTGGYRGTPVLQIGADVYIDSQRIARELERRFPEPSLFPHGDAGLGYASVKWADAYFRAGLHMAIALNGASWPEEFRRDRQQLFPDVDFERIDLEHAKAQFRACAGFVDEQLADGRPVSRREFARAGRHTRMDHSMVWRALTCRSSTSCLPISPTSRPGKGGSRRWGRARAWKAPPRRHSSRRCTIDRSPARSPASTPRI
jgi:glutathione S-transferase